MCAGVGTVALGATTSSSGYWTGTDAPEATVAVVNPAAPRAAVATGEPEVTIDVSTPLSGPSLRQSAVTARLRQHGLSRARASGVTEPSATAAERPREPGPPSVAPTGPAVPVTSDAPSTALADDTGLVTPNVTSVVVVPATPSDATPGAGDAVEVTTDRALDPRSICGIWSPSVGAAQTLADVNATLAQTANPAVASLTFSTVAGVCGPAGLVLGTVGVDGRHLVADGSDQPVLFLDGTLMLDAAGFTLAVVLGDPDAADRLQGVTDPVPPSFTVTDAGPRDLGGLPLAPGVLVGTGAF